MGTSTVIKTEHTMITLLYFPTAMAVLDFGLPRKASNRRATVKSHLETALHHYPHSPLSLSTSSWRKPHNWGARRIA